MTFHKELPFIVVLLFSVLGVLVWASHFKTDKTMRSGSKIVIEGTVKIIHAPESGVLKTIDVHEGDHVIFGQILGTMQSRAAQVAVDDVLSAITINQIAKVRAIAALEGVKPDFSDFDDLFASAISAQVRLFDRNRIALEAEVTNVVKQKNIAVEQLKKVQALYASGDVGFTALSKSEREVILIEEEIAEVRETWRHRARKEIVVIEQQISKLRHKLSGRQTILGSSKLTAPHDGVVTMLRFKALGGVLRAGDELMRISTSIVQN